MLYLPTPPKKKKLKQECIRAQDLQRRTPTSYRVDQFPPRKVWPRWPLTEVWKWTQADEPRSHLTLSLRPSSVFHALGLYFPFPPHLTGERILCRTRVYLKAEIKDTLRGSCRFELQICLGAERGLCRHQSVLFNRSNALGRKGVGMSGDGTEGGEQMQWMGGLISNVHLCYL